MRNTVFAAFAFVATVAVPVSARTQPVDNMVLTVTGERADHALNVYQARVAAEPRDGAAWLNIAILQDHAGRHAEAQQAVDRVMALDNAVVQNQFGDDVWTHAWAQGVSTRTTQLSLR